MQAVHIIVQSKGGSGKSFLAAILTQYLKAEIVALSMPIPIHCYDTDPGNHTFAGYKAFNTQIVPILPEGTTTIDARIFDGMIEEIIDKDGIAVIDNGAGSFIPLIQYLSECSVIELLQSMNIEVYFHVPVIGGQSMDDTFLGLAKVLNLFNANVIIWANEHFGKLEKDGKSFTEFKLITDNDDKILGIVNMKRHVDNICGKDIAEMLKHSLTFNEILTSSFFTRMQRHRLLAVQNEFFESLSELPLINPDQLNFAYD